MIKFFKDKEENKIYVTFFKTDQFHDIVDDIKNYLDFDRENKKGWYGSSNNLYRAYLSLLQFNEEIIISKELLDEITPKLTIKNIRRPFNNDLILIPPFKGKFPFENYQMEDIKKFYFLNRGGIFLDMRMGKGYEIINILNQLYYHKYIDKIVYITPIAGIYNVKREFFRFSNLFKEEDFYIANSVDRKPFNDNTKIILMTYRTFLMISEDYYKESDNYKKKVKRYEKEFKQKVLVLIYIICYLGSLWQYSELLISMLFNISIPLKLLDFDSPVLPLKDWIKKDAAIILDECQALDNHRSKQSNAFHVHSNLFEYRYLLSGTPVDKIENYYSLIKFLDKSLIIDDYLSWLGKIANIGNRFSKEAVNFYKEEKVKEFQDMINPYIVRRLKSECLDVPKNIIIKNYIKISNEQMNIYIDLIQQELNIIKEENGYINTKSVINKFPFISQALDNPELLKGKIDKDKSFKLFNNVEKFKFLNHSKLEVLDDLVDKYINNEDRKLIIFDYHPLTLDKMKDYYKKYKPLIIHGETKIKGMNREQYRDYVINEFKTNKNRKMLLASMQVMDVAINLTECNRQVYFCRNYSMIKASQSIERIQGKDQKEETITHYLILEKTIDERLDMMLEKKINLNTNFFKKDYLTESECLQIFSGIQEIS